MRCCRNRLGWKLQDLGWTLIGRPRVVDGKVQLISLLGHHNIAVLFDSESGEAV